MKIFYFTRNEKSTNILQGLKIEIEIFIKIKNIFHLSGNN